MTPAPRSSASPTPTASDIESDRLVEELGVGARQRVEILKVLYRGARIIILDEPTAVLVPQEVDELFGNLRELKKEGLSVIFISHKLDEVLAAADEITVIRRGTTVKTVDPQDVTARQLAELMVGSELPSPSTETSTVTDEVLLSVKNLSLPAPGSRPLLDDISFEIHKGEVLGIAGRGGQRPGRARRVDHGHAAGLDRRDHARPASTCTTSRPATAARPASATSPRTVTATACCSTSPLWENRVLGHQNRPPSARGPLIDKRGARADTERIIKEYDVRTPGPQRARPCAVRRQPAEAHRRPRDERRPDPAHRRRTRPVASTSAPRPRSGATSRPLVATDWRCC